MPRVTVVIPNYNGLRFMEPCVSALEAQTYTDFCVLIVDNGSTDGSVDWIGRFIKEGDAPFETRAVFLDTNTGFAGAANTGIENADSELVLLLNNDTEPTESFIEELVRPFDKDKDGRLFAVSPKMIQLYDKDLLDDAGDGYALLGWAFQRGVGRRVDEPKFQKEKEVTSACAGASMYRRSLLLKLAYKGEDSEGNVKAEPFDTAHFAYLEDIDLSLRARTEGYRVIYAPRAAVYHVGSGTSGSRYNSFKVRLAARNQIWLNYKNMPIFMLLLNLAGILIGMLIKLFFFTRIGFGKDYKDGIKEGLSDLKKARKRPFKLKNTGNYIRIELRLIGDTFSYAEDLLKRRLAKRKTCISENV